MIELSPVTGNTLYPLPHNWLIITKFIKGKSVGTNKTSFRCILLSKPGIRLIVTGH
jgi:hypothetical protein